MKAARKAGTLLLRDLTLTTACQGSNVKGIVNLGVMHQTKGLP